MHGKNTLSKVTIYDVAERAGVSAMTVSRVLRNKGNIAPETREHVKKIIKEMNYEPLSSARNLSGAFPRTIGIVVPDAKELKEFRHGYEYEYGLLIGALNLSKDYDFSVNIIEIRDSTDISLLVKKVLARQVGGYIVPAPVTEYPELLNTLRDQKIIFSAVSPFDSERYDLVVVGDERKATRLLAEELISLGHRKIDFVGGIGNHRATFQRQLGFMDAIKSNINSTSIEYSVHNCSPFFEDGFEAGIRLLSKKDRPTAVQCLTDDIAAGLIAAANKLKINLPGQLSITGFDNFGLARKISPALTTAILPAEEMGEAAALQVIEALEGRSYSAEKLLDCSVLIRESIAKVPRSIKSV